MIWLLLSLAALGGGPLLAASLRTRGGALYLLDGFVLSAVALLVIGHVLPEAAEVAGPVVLLAAVAGFALPSVAERMLEGAHRRTHRWVLAVAMAGLLLHSALDGAGIRLDEALGMAVLCHNLPVGLLIWLTVRPLFGTRAAWVALAANGLATVAGYAGSDAFAGSEEIPWVALLTAFVAGGLLHLLVHQTRPGVAVKSSGAWGALGAVGAVVVLLAGSWWESAGEAGRSLEALVDAAPHFTLVLWLPVLAGGTLSALVVAGRRVPSFSRLKQSGVAAGLWLAVITPVCSCGTLPVYEDLVGHGSSRRSALAFLLTAPALRPEALLLLALLLGWPIALAWLAGLLVLTAVMPVLVAPLMNPLRDARLAGHDSGHDEEQPGVEEGRNASAWKRALNYISTDWMDHHCAWMLLALGLVLQGWELPLADVLPSLAWPEAHPYLATLVVAAVFAPLQLNATATVLLALILVGLRLPPGAVLAALLLGPTTGVATRRTLRRLHGSTAATVFTGAIMAAAVALGCALNAATISGLARGGDNWVWPPVWQRMEGVGASLWIWLVAAGPFALWIVVGLLLLPVVVSFARCGPRGWLAEILPAHEHEHAHHPGAPHDHRGREQVQIDVAEGT